MKKTIKSVQIQKVEDPTTETPEEDTESSPALPLE